MNQSSSTNLLPGQGWQIALLRCLLKLSWVGRSIWSGVDVFWQFKKRSSPPLKLWPGILLFNDQLLQLVFYVWRHCWQEIQVKILMQALRENLFGKSTIEYLLWHSITCLIHSIQALWLYQCNHCNGRPLKKLPLNLCFQKIPSLFDCVVKVRNHLS